LFVLHDIQMILNFFIELLLFLLPYLLHVVMAEFEHIVTSKLVHLR